MTWTTRPRSDRGTLSLIEAGRGPHVVLIHGVGLRAEAWGAQLDALAASFHVKALDMPGHGGSEMLAPGATLADYSDAVAVILDGPSVVIGHSMGAMIALDLAIRHAEQVCGVAALNAIFQRDTEARGAVQARAAALDGKRMTDPTATLERWFGDAASEARASCHAWLTMVDPKGYRAAYRIFAQHNGPPPEALARITCPALFMTGSAEPNSTPTMSKAMALRTPKGTAHIVEGAAHMMPMTHGEVVNRYLTDFARTCHGRA